MKNPEIISLYKYQTYSANSITSLINGTIWLAKPSSFNDPFDCLPYFHLNLNQTDVVKFLKKEFNNYEKKLGLLDNKIKEQFEFINSVSNKIYKISNNSQNQVPEDDINKYNAMLMEIFEKTIDNIGVFSFTELDNNILMWSHYADQHKGFCVEYERTRTNIFGQERTLPVKYSSNKPKFKLSDLVTLTDNSKKKIIKSIVLSKSNDWKYEKEWRYINPTGNIPMKNNAKITPN